MNIFRRKHHVKVTYLALVGDGAAATVRVDFKTPNGNEVSLPLSFPALRRFADELIFFAPNDEIIVSRDIFTGEWRMENDGRTIVGGVSNLVAGIWHEAFSSHIRYLDRCRLVCSNDPLTKNKLQFINCA